MHKLSVIQFISARHEWGGVEQHAKDLAKGLKERGHDVYIVARPVAFITDMYREVCPVFTYPIRGAVDIESILGIAKLIREKQVDIIHTHTSRDAWTALLASFVAGRGKVITTRHVALPAKRDLVHRWFYRQLASIICVSRFVRDIFLGSQSVVGSSKVQVIYPGINLDKLKTVEGINIRKNSGFSPGHFVVGFVGRITQEKGLDDLLKAFAIVFKEKPEARLLLVGEVNPVTPQYLTYLKSLAHELNISPYIHFYGFCKQIADVMNSLDVLVLPSNDAETFGMVLGEAMACGKPVIATDIGGQKEFIRDGVNGYLVPINAPDQIAERILRLANDKQLAASLGAEACSDISGCWNLESTVENTESCYLKLAE